MTLLATTERRSTAPQDLSWNQLTLLVFIDLWACHNFLVFLIRQLIDAVKPTSPKILGVQSAQYSLHV
ncbi:hypothetical protein J6590_002067 [Homalodisca vitripennis]|nr:hypothetical protein J6590_002067 [Homalodisca vitripennis]